MERYGLLFPFRRGPRDFVGGSGAALVTAKAHQVLLTEPGELPWRTSFGAGLARLRHQNNDEVLQELARVVTRDALSRWAPSLQLLQLAVVPDAQKLVIRLRVTDSTNGPTRDMELEA